MVVSKLNNFIYIITVLFLNAQITLSLTCDEILEFPESKKFTLQELQTTKPKEIVQCLAHLGKEQMAPEVATFIWEVIVQECGGVSNIPGRVLMLLHWVTPAVTPEQYANLSFNNIDVVQNFGFNYHLSEQQLSAIADRVREDFAGKEPEDYTFYDLVALRQILCAFNRSEIERIHPSAYREAAVMIGKLDNCRPEVLMGFASLAVQRSGFGAPETWSRAMVEAFGVVSQYLPQDIIQKYAVN